MLKANVGYLYVNEGIFLDGMATQAQTAVRYEIEKHNNVSETTQLSFKIDKHERFLDVTDNARIVTSGNFNTFDGLLFIESFNFRAIEVNIHAASGVLCSLCNTEAWRLCNDGFYD